MYTTIEIKVLLKDIQIITFFLLLVFPNVCYSQSFTWQRLYNGPNSYSSDNGRDIILARNGNFYVTGHELSELGSRACVLKLKPNGDTIWTRYIYNFYQGSSFLFSNAIVLSIDGGCVFTGTADQTYSCKLDSNGNTIWFRKYNDGSVQCFDIISTIDGGYLLCGDQIGNIRHGYLLKIDSLGNFEWKKTFSAGYVKRFFSLVQTSIGESIVVGYKYDCGTCLTKNFLLKIDSNGDSLNENEYDFDIKKIVKLNNGYLVGGTTFDKIHNQVHFAKFSPNGNLMYKRTLEYDGKENFKDIQVLNENRFVLTADTYTFDLDTINAGVYVTDSLGNIIFRNVFGVTNYSIFYSILPLFNGDIAFIGTVETYLPQRRDIFVVRTDSTLFAKHVGINQFSSLINKDYTLFQNYPNPFNPVTYIPLRIYSGLGIDIKLKIFDITGKEIHSFSKNSLNKGYNIIRFNGSNLSSGTYFYSLFINHVVIDTKKMTIIK